jgi:hypothetical protein
MMYLNSKHINSLEINWEDTIEVIESALRGVVQCQQYAEGCKVVARRDSIV